MSIQINTNSNHIHHLRKNNFQGTVHQNSFCAGAVSGTTNPQFPTKIPAEYTNLPQPNIPVSYTKIGVFKTRFGNNDFHYFKLSNGQNVAIVKKDCETIVGTRVKVNSVNEEQDNQRGISHFIERSIISGSKHYTSGDVYETLNSINAQIKTETCDDETDYRIISNKKMTDGELEQAISLQADMLQRPTFLNDVIEEKKEPVISEIKAKYNSLKDIKNRAIKNLFGIEQSASGLTEGSIDNITRLTRDDVLQYWQTYYTPGNMTTVVIGDVDVDKTIELIAKHFNAKPAQANKTFKPLILTKEPKRIDTVSETDDKSRIVAAFAGSPSSNPKENIVLAMLCSNFSLGKDESELNLQERLKQQIDAEFDIDLDRISSNEQNVITMSISAPEENSQKAIDILYDAIQHLKNNPPAENDIKAMGLLMAFGGLSLSPEDHIDHIAESINNGSYKKNVEYGEIIQKLTPEDFVNTINKYFDLNKISLGVSHAKGTTKDEIFKRYSESKYRTTQKT